MPVFAVELHLVGFVIKQRGSFKRNEVFLGDALYDFWRVKEAIAIMLPERNVISVVANTVADRINADDLGCLKPVGLLMHALRQVAGGNHLGALAQI